MLSSSNILNDFSNEKITKYNRQEVGGWGGVRGASVLIVLD